VAINAGDFDLVYDAGKAEPKEQLAEKEADGATVKQCLNLIPSAQAMLATAAFPANA